MARTSSGVYRGVSAEDRRAERRRRLMDAAIELMGTEGWAATTVRGVCAQAKLTPRFFYESFADIDALAVAVLDEIIDAATGRVLAGIAAAPADDPEAQLRAAIEAFVSELTDDPRRARIAFVEALGSEPLTRRRLEVMRGYAGLIAAQARAVYHATGEPDPFVDLVAHMFVGGMAELLITWMDGGLPHTREQLIDDCVALGVAGAAAAARVAPSRRRG